MAAARPPLPAERGAVSQRVARLGGALESAVTELIGVPSVGGTPGELDILSVAARIADSLGLTATVIEHDVDAVSARAGFPGMEVSRPRLASLLATASEPTESPGLLLLGHLDVVPADLSGWSGDPFLPTWSTDDTGHRRIVGRGAVDMKGGVAAALIAAAALRSSGVPLAAEVAVAAVIGEEDGGSGTFALLEHLRGDLPADLRGSAGVRGVPVAPARFGGCIIPEPTDLHLVTANGGSLTFRLTITGTAAHGAMRWNGRNPIEALPAVLAALRTIEQRWNTEPDPRFARWPIPFPLSVGTINSGHWASTVPAQADITGRLGVPIGLSAGDARERFTLELGRLLADTVDLPVEVAWWGGAFEPTQCAADAEIAAAIAAAATAIASAAQSAAAADLTDRIDPPIGMPYGSDMRLVQNLAGIETVLFGPGDPAAAHTEDESAEWADVVLAAEVLARAALEFVGVAESR